MRFEVEAGRCRRSIEVEPSGSEWVVTVDGQTMMAQLAQVGANWSLLVRRGVAGAPRVSEVAHGGAARSYEVAFEAGGRGEYAVQIDGRGVSVSILDPRKRAARGHDGPPSATGPSSVVSPMPGRVIKVLVAPGDVVAAGQGVVVVEAMKMENELRAPRAGTIAEVCVREGAPVDAGAVLVVVGP